MKKVDTPLTYILQWRTILWEWVVRVQIVETSVFTNQIRAELDDESYRMLQVELVRDPESGALIRGTRGIRKIRWARKGHGKRGGIRVIYYWHRPRETLLMLLAYGKSARKDLTPEQRKRLRQVVREELG